MSTKRIIDAMVRRYGEDWFTYQPPESRPFIFSQNVSIPIFDPLPLSDTLSTRVCRQNVLVNDMAVIEYYSVRGLVVIPNPDWVGVRIGELNEYDLQGRIAWRPDIQGNSPFEIANSYGQTASGVPLNIIPKNNPLVPDLNQESYISALRTQEKPRILVMPGQDIGIKILFRNEGYGVPLPPLPSEVVGVGYYLVAEVRGYYVPIPEDYELRDRQDSMFSTNQSSGYGDPPVRLEDDPPALQIEGGLTLRPDLVQKLQEKANRGRRGRKGGRGGRGGRS